MSNKTETATVTRDASKASNAPVQPTEKERYAAQIREHNKGLREGFSGAMSEAFKTGKANGKRRANKILASDVPSEGPAFLAWLDAQDNANVTH